MPRSTQVPAASFSISSTGLSPAVAELSSSLPLPTPESRMPALQPRMVETTRFGLFPFRSPLLWESRLISLPPGTEMFHFPGLASLGLYIQLRMTGHDSLTKPSGILSSAGHEKSCVKQRGPSRKAKYSRETDSEPVP